MRIGGLDHVETGLSQLIRNNRAGRDIGLDDHHLRRGRFELGRHNRIAQE